MGARRSTPAEATGHPLLAGLNAPQQAAVRHDSGPLIVLAGPGVGKTRVIIHRIAWAIRERGVRPEKVLAVTFTVKAAAEMRDRLTRLLSDAESAPVQVHTFNGLGWRLLQRFGDMLGLPAETLLIDEVQSRRLLREIILKENLFPESRGEGLDPLAARATRAIEGLSNLGKLPGECTRFAQAWRESLGATSDEAEKAKCEIFAHEARAYEVYTHERLARGWITYNDQILLPIRLLRERPGAAAIIRSELSSIVVDEFQDCNPAQIEFLRLLCGGGVRGGASDVAVVGDDDQAIYAFRGSDEQAFARFSQGWSGATVIELTDNYRSGQSVVDVANAIIARAGRRFHSGKTLRRAPDSGAPDARVQAVSLDAELNDGSAIAAMIRTDAAEHAENADDEGWSRYAVIARTNGDLDRVAESLRLEGVPFDRHTERSILDDEGVEDLLAWVQWLVDPGAHWAARRVLRRPPHSLPPEQALRLDVAYTAQRSQARAGAPGVSDPGSFAEWLEREHGADPEAPGVASIVARYRALREQVHGVRADEAVRLIMTTLDLAHADLLPARERARRVAALIAFLSLARDKQPRLESPGDLHALWGYIEELRELKAFAPSAGLGDIDADRSEQEGPQSSGRVRLLTAHRAKGLEFDTVFVPRASGQHGYGSVRNDDSWEAPPGFFDRLDPRDPLSRGRDEQRRLFYVACTRAVRRLVVLAKERKKPSATPHYFEELTRTATHPLPVELVSENDVLAQAAAAGVVAARPAPLGAVHAGDEPMLEIGTRIQASARAEAAGAIEMLSHAELTDAERTTARERLAAAGDRIAWVASVLAGRGVPRGVRDPEVLALAERRVVETARPPRPAGLSAPLRLSYTLISQYIKCPRCFYLHHVLKLKERETDETGLGQLLHRVLQSHFEGVRRAESEGHTPPGLPDLLRLGRDEYHRSLGCMQSVDLARLDQINAQLSNCINRLHTADANILEIERSITLPYECDGITHSMHAKIDRVDQLPDGTYRVVDYKTGKAIQPLTAPKPDDLQMGIYAMALRELYGANLDGVCEYWILESGVRGTLPLGKIDQGKVRGAIDAAVRGMLAGDFPPGPTCKKDCVLFPGASPAPSEKPTDNGVRPCSESSSP